MARELTSLDTNHLIRVLVTGTVEDAQISLWLGKGSSLTRSSIVWYEFLFGPIGENEMAIVQGSFFATSSIEDFQPFVPFGLRLKIDNKVAP